MTSAEWLILNLEENQYQHMKDPSLAPRRLLARSFLDSPVSYDVIESGLADPFPDFARTTG